MIAHLDADEIRTNRREIWYVRKGSFSLTPSLEGFVSPNDRATEAPSWRASTKIVCPCGYLCSINATDASAAKTFVARTR